MWHDHISGTGFALAITLAVTPAAVAQAIDVEPTASEVANLLRTRGHAGTARAVLTQAYGPKSSQAMDEIADTLTAIAGEYPGKDEHSASIRRAALSTLLLAGLGHTGIVGRDRASPYPGAAKRLMLLTETADDVGIRGASIDGLLQLPDRATTLAFLRQVATSNNKVAWFAVSCLGNRTGREGQAIARDLFRLGSVSDPTARETLDGIAKGYGWQ